MSVRHVAMPVSRHIWKTRYRQRRADGRPERSLFDTWRRVAVAVASVETGARDRTYWQERFLWLLGDFRFLPGGRILAGAGTALDVTLCNCFVMGTIEDNLQSIFDNLKEGALTMQAGGGVGYDFSTLRPQGSRAVSTGRIASGPVSFLHIWNAMCATVLSTGSRRGAMIGTLRCDHPDLELFIAAKRQRHALTHFNLSVQISDEFMRAVESDDSWPLVFPVSLTGEDPGETIVRSWPGFSGPVACRVFKRRPARQLWDAILTAAYETAEPGVLFIDRINRRNNLAYRENITATNPCGEIPLPPYGACNLGSINLTRFVNLPFTASACLDYHAIARVAGTAVRFLDNVLDCSSFPLEKQAEQAHGSRRTGLGITGLADALILLGLDYGSAAARVAAKRVMACICHSAYRASIRLAREKGPFPFLDREAFLRSEFVSDLPDDIRRDIARLGIRNSHLTAIAPCGTISLLAGNVSSGIEPVFDFHLQRKILDSGGEYRYFDLEDPAYSLWQAQHGQGDDLPEYFVTSGTVPPESQLLMQESLQDHVDNAISKTINLPIHYDFDRFRHLYQFAYQHGLKGCTAFRPNPTRGELLAHGAARGTDVHCCHIDREAD